MDAKTLRELIAKGDARVLSGYLVQHCEAIAQALEDAERYRWLRDGPPKIEWPTKKFPTPPWCVCVDKEVGLPTTRPIFGSELDAAIDTVRAKEQGK